MPADALIEEPLLVAGVLLFNVALCDVLDRRTPLRHLGAAMLVIVVTAIEANLGLIPTFSPDVVVYTGIFDSVAPLGIFWLLLLVDLKLILRAGATMLGLFALGAAGTAVGAIVGMKLVGTETFGDLAGPLGGMFTATYTGGSVNFNAIALHYQVNEQGVLYAGANAVDASMNAVWIVLTIVLARFLRRVWGQRPRPSSPAAGSAQEQGVPSSAEPIQPLSLALALATGAVVVSGSELAVAWIESISGVAVPSVLVLTTVALILAQTPWARSLTGVRTLGLVAIHLFLAVIGALCDFAAVVAIGQLAVSLVILVTVILSMHTLFTFVGAAVFRWDPDVAAVASQANVGGGGSALAVAKSLDRPELAVPGILVGSAGTAVGTFLGFAVAAWLGA